MDLHRESRAGVESAWSIYSGTLVGQKRCAMNAVLWFRSLIYHKLKAAFTLCNAFRDNEKIRILIRYDSFFHLWLQLPKFCIIPQGHVLYYSHFTQAFLALLLNCKLIEGRVTDWTVLVLCVRYLHPHSWLSPVQYLLQPWAQKM